MKSRLSAISFQWSVARLIVGLLITAHCLLLTGPAGAQAGEPTDDEVNAIARQLYCPVCENIPLDACPTQACIQWRATIKEKLALGWSEQQIKDYFVQQYGERVLAQPSARGLNLLVWVLPPLAVLAAASIYIYVLRRLRRPVPAAAGAPAPASEDDYVKRLEEELSKRR
jgi:cytochrome c-type biogenesis protein CcmH